MTTWETRHRIWMRYHSVGKVPRWVRLALAGQLRTMIVGGTPR